MKRATFKKCHVYSESIITALVDIVQHNSSTAATLQRPSYDFEPLTTLTLDLRNAKRSATVAQAVGEVLSDTIVRSPDDFLDVCAAEVDTKAFNKALSQRKRLQVYGGKARTSIEAEIEGIINRKVWEGIHWKQLSKTQKKEILQFLRTYMFQMVDVLLG